MEGVWSEKSWERECEYDHNVYKILKELIKIRAPNIHKSIYNRATWGKQNGKEQVRVMLNRDVFPV